MRAIDAQMKRQGHGVVMIHGGCGKRDDDGKAYEGADEIAHDIAIALGWKIERYPADWNLGPRAGPLRNSYMADHAYPERGISFGRLFGNNGKTTGTGDMVMKLNTLGIRVQTVALAGDTP